MTQWSEVFLTVVIVLLCCNAVTAQVLSVPRDQPRGLRFPHTSLCCNKAGQKLMSCLLNSSMTADTSNTTPSKLAAVMYTYATPNIHNYAALACAVNTVYAEGNGYKFEILTQDETNSYEPRDPRWNKVKILIDAMDNEANADVDYFVWIDADMIVLDMGIKIEEIGSQYPNIDILMSKDVIQNKDVEKKTDVPDGLANSGYVLVRHTRWARQVLFQWWSDYERHQMSDQSAFLLMYKSMKSDEQAKIRILPPDALNTMFPAWLNQQPSNQFLHLAGESDIYREEVFGHAFDSLCTYSANQEAAQIVVTVDGSEESEARENEIVRDESFLPRQLGLTREKLFQEWSVLDMRRVAKLITWRDDFLALQEEFNRRSKKKRFRVIDEYEEYVESTCSGIHNILKNSANEENDKKHRGNRHTEMDKVTIALKKLCFESFCDIAVAREDIYLASIAPANDKNGQDASLMVAEKFRSAMSSGYDLINFVSEVKAYSVEETKQEIFSAKEIFEMLDQIGEDMLPKLKKHLPSSLVHRGMYYEFKYYEFLATALTENDRGDDIMDALANAINVWRALHKEHRYYGSDYKALDELREGWSIISRYGLMACSEATGTLTQLGVDSLKDSILLLESTFKDLNGNPLATPPLKDSVAFDLSVAHANCGLCTKQLNMKLSLDGENTTNLILIIKNLKKSHKHFEKSLIYAQYVDQSSGTSNHEHEEYITSQMSTVEKEIRQLDGLRKEMAKDKNFTVEKKGPPTPPVVKKKLMRKKKKKN